MVLPDAVFRIFRYEVSAALVVSSVFSAGEQFECFVEEERNVMSAIIGLGSAVGGAALSLAWGLLGIII